MYVARPIHITMHACKCGNVVSNQDGDQDQAQRANFLQNCIT